MEYLPTSTCSTLKRKPVRLKNLTTGARAAAIAVCVLGSSLAVANPAQFIAKQYTEALGRAPDPAGWSNNLQYLKQHSCNKNTLKDVAKGVFGSPEYNRLGYDSNEKVLTLYRALFSREPDAGGFNYWRSYLDGGNSMATAIDFMFQAIDGAELTTAKICGSLGFGTHGPARPSTCRSAR